MLTVSLRRSGHPIFHSIFLGIHTLFKYNVGMLKFFASAVTGLVLVVITGNVLFGVMKSSLNETVKEKPAVLGLPAERFDLLRIEIEFEGRDYEAIVLPINPDELTLNSNLEEKKISREIVGSGECKAVVSGGFYTKEGSHVGLFIENFVQIQGARGNSLFDGFFSINSLDTPRITRILPDDSLREAIQTGPLLIENDVVINLEMRNDKLKRRILVAVDGSNKMYLITVYNPDSSFEGPFLEDLPEVVTKIEQYGYDFADAINLDGGTASAFYVGNIHLPELSSIGSYFCVS